MLRFGTQSRSGDSLLMKEEKRAAPPSLTYRRIGRITFLSIGKNLFGVYGLVLSHLTPGACFGSRIRPSWGSEHGSAGVQICFIAAGKHRMHRAEVRDFPQPRGKFPAFLKEGLDRFRQTRSPGFHLRLPLGGKDGDGPLCIRQSGELDFMAHGRLPGGVSACFPPRRSAAINQAAARPSKATGKRMKLNRAWQASTQGVSMSSAAGCPHAAWQARRPEGLEKMDWQKGLGLTIALRDTPRRLAVVKPMPRIPPDRSSTFSTHPAGNSVGVSSSAAAGTGASVT
jgi:hypothetical protein